MLTLIGLGSFVFFFGGALWRNSYRWRYLAESYAADGERPIEERTMQSAVLVDGYGFNSLKGILKIGLHAKGVSLRVMKPFSLFHAPLFIPYGDIQGWETSWYLDASSTELEFARSPKLKVVMSEDQARWIQSYSGRDMKLAEKGRPSESPVPIWNVFALIGAGASMGMLALLGWIWITGPMR